MTTYTRTTISIPAHVLTLGQERAAKFRLSFSDYLARLVEEEAKLQRGTMTLVAETPAVFHHTPTPAEAAKARQPARYSKAKGRKPRKTRPAR